VDQSVQETVPGSGVRANRTGLYIGGLDPPVRRLGLDELDTDGIQLGAFGPDDPVAYGRLDVTYPETTQ